MAIDKAVNKDRDLLIEAGLSELEADVIVATAEVWNKFFLLPIMHESDRREVEFALHVIQEKVFSRPIYDKYRCSK